MSPSISKYPALIADLSKTFSDYSDNRKLDITYDQTGGSCWRSHKEDLTENLIGKLGQHEPWENTRPSKADTVSR